MPELPEVETVRRGLEPVLVGERIARVEQRRPDLRFPFPEAFVERLQGRRITHLGRRAKYLHARLEGGDVLVMHLGMSGRFTIAPPLGAEPAAFSVDDTGGDPRHDHVVLHIGTGARVTYNDPRRFGFMLLVPEAEIEAHPLFAGLGPEPLGNALNAAYIAARAHRRKTELKAFLLDQRNIAGLGNIYVCEALHRVGLAPHRPAALLATRTGQPSRHADPLVAAIRTVLEAAIVAGGSTLKDYRKADGALGYFQHQFLVYGREGEPCTRPLCRGTVHRTIQAGRSTFHCPICQR